MIMLKQSIIVIPVNIIQTISSITTMQAQSIPTLSQKSRSILHRFKYQLKQKSLLLRTHIFNLFTYNKQKLNKKQFHKLILKYDRNLVRQEIDGLFVELDNANTGYVAVELIRDVLETIGQDDNPYSLVNRNSLLRNSMIEGDISTLSNVSLECMNEQAFNVLSEMRQKLTQNSQYLQTIQLFMTEKDGYLTKLNMKQLMDNLCIRDPNKIKMGLDILFGKSQRIQLCEFLKALDLDHDGTRIRLEDFKIEQSVILDVRKSGYIRHMEGIRQSIGRESQAQESRILDALNDTDNLRTSRSLIYGLEMIPKPIQKYFNNCSQLQQNFSDLAELYLQNNMIFIDKDSPTYQKAATWIHIVEYNPQYLIFQATSSIVYREDRKGLGTLLQPKDITQGKFGNCYFLSAVAAIVEQYPQLIYRLFVLEKNPSHIYGVRIFVDGIWKTIAVDGCFPLTQQGKFCGAQPHHSKIWVMLLQKAWAKIFKTYENIHSGYNEQGLIAITGAPTIITLVKQNNFLQKVQSQFKKGCVITCTTAKHVSQISQTQQQKLGVFAGHAYTILRIYDGIKDGENEITLLKMKNPWGDKAWKGDWSFQSKKWTKQLRNKLTYNYDSKDGTFFICLQDFIKYFDHVNISKLVIGNCNSHIINNANRFNFYQNRIHITLQGQYFFTIYQQNGRKYKNSPGVYQKSPSWIFLAQINETDQHGGITVMDAITSNASSYQYSTIEGYLLPGDYVIVSRVNWNYWEEHQYVITSYGPTTVCFDPCRVAPVEYLNSFITSRALRIIHESKANVIPYKDTTIFKSFYFEHSQGIGFIAVSNSCPIFQQIHNKYQAKDKQKCRIIQSTFILQQCKGIQALQPFKMPVVIRAGYKEITVACFIVDPSGYSYKLLEGYKLYADTK